MIIIFVIVSSFARLKQEITCNHFKNSTCKRPNVSWSILISSYYNFWRSILSGLNFRSEVMMSPAPISHVTNFDHYLFIQFSSSLIMELVILFFHLLNSLSWHKLFLSRLIFLRGFIIIFRFLVIILFFLWNINIDVINIINWIIIIHWSTDLVPLTFA